MTIGFHCSQEQFSPSELLKYVIAAENAGFKHVMSADHFNPWSARQGQSGFTWSWLGAALQATENITFGSLAIPGGARYHPVILAQTTATLCEMFPKRFEWIAAGSGQLLNERVIDVAWPAKEVRNERLRKSVEIIRSLWNGETVTESGLITANEAKLWTLPEYTPKVFAAALSPETAAFAASWADGLITVNQPEEKLITIIDSFRQNGGKNKPLYLQFHISWHENEEQALEQAYDQWRTNVFPAELSENLFSPELYDDVAEKVRREDMHQHVSISSDIGFHIEAIKKLFNLGFERIYLHNTGRNQSEFIKMAGRELVPLFNDLHKR